MPNEHVWRALCNDTDASVTICDREGRILYANEHSNRVFRWQQASEPGHDPEQEGADRETVADAAARTAIEERLRLFARVCDTGRGLAYESLVQGIRQYVTVRPIENDAGQTLAIITARRMHAWERADTLADDTLDLVEPETHDPGILATLSPRELDVLILLGSGLPHADIAERLGLSIRTIERHRDRLGQKLRAGNRVDLARFAIRAGLAELPDPAQAHYLKDHPRDPLDLPLPLRKIARRRVRATGLPI
ncbi:MAG: LuxR C-terminal-related transcriptional regulator [Planctomycetota bacterium]|nr:LuxR C-terminal-related transcriptional regulator [Planctomycetota bacterium]